MNYDKLYPAEKIREKIAVPIPEWILQSNLCVYTVHDFRGKKYGQLILQYASSQLSLWRMAKRYYAAFGILHSIMASVTFMTLSRRYVLGLQVISIFINLIHIL